MSGYYVEVLAGAERQVLRDLSWEKAREVEAALLLVLAGVDAVFCTPEQVWRVETQGGAGVGEVEVIVGEEAGQ